MSDPRRHAPSLVVVSALTLTLSACGTQDVTRPRLEASLNQAFSNLYVQRAQILGDPGVTVASIAADASCDRGGPSVADVGPGADWICMVSFRDDQGVLQKGKFEIAAKANSTYVATGPSKLLGPVMIPDAGGHLVLNPPFEFDAAFDPHG